MKRLLKRALGHFGFEVQRIRVQAGESVPYQLFSDLARSYEHLLGGVPEDTGRAHLIAQLSGTTPAEAYTLLQALHTTSGLGGAVCEFGVAQGRTSALLAHEILDSDRELHLFDSFEGLPKPGPDDQLKDDIFGLGSIEAYEGRMASPLTLVQQRLAQSALPPERVVIHRGAFADILAQASGLPERVSLAYVDFDFHDPVAEALAFLQDVTVPGAVVVVDDYDFFSTGATVAVDRFLERHRAHWQASIALKAFGHSAVLTRLS